MNPLFLGPLIEMGKSLIDRLIPDKTAQAAAKLELLKISQDQDFQTNMQQLVINAKEAEHPTIFVAGWRPFIGWVCGFGLVYQTILHNIIEWVASINGWPLPVAPDTGTLLYVLGALLGIGGLRTVEKIKGVAAK